MKVPKVVTPYDQLEFDPLRFVDQVPVFEESEASTGFWDLSQVVQRLKCWQERYPAIRPVYVLRRNDDPQIIRIASAYGCRFVCSSRGETEELLRNNVPVEDIQWSNAVLSLRDCKYARSAKINSLQVGRSSALYDIKTGHPESSITLSVSLDSPELAKGGCQLGFSHTFEEVEESLQIAKELKLNVNGIAITKNSNWNEVTVEEVFRKAQNVVSLSVSLGFNIETVTIPEVIKDPSLDSLLHNLQKVEEMSGKVFNENPVKICLETNDSLTTAALTIFMTVQAVRRINTPGGGEEKVQYFVDDGRHNSFRKVPRTVRYSEVHFIRRSSKIIESETRYSTEVFGPSCDGDDIVVSNVQMPELSLGDLIYLTNVGSDTIATRTNFNGFLNCNCHYFIRRGDLAHDQQQQQQQRRF